MQIDSKAPQGAFPNRFEVLGCFMTLQVILNLSVYFQIQEKSWKFLVLSLILSVVLPFVSVILVFLIQKNSFKKAKLAISLLISFWFIIDFFCRTEFLLKEEEESGGFSLCQVFIQMISLFALLRNGFTPNMIGFSWLVIGVSFVLLRTGDYSSLASISGTLSLWAGLIFGLFVSFYQMKRKIEDPKWLIDYFMSNERAPLLIINTNNRKILRKNNEAEKQRVDSEYLESLKTEWLVTKKNKEKTKSKKRIERSQRAKSQEKQRQKGFWEIMKKWESGSEQNSRTLRVVDGSQREILVHCQKGTGPQVICRMDIDNEGLLNNRNSEKEVKETLGQAIQMVKGVSNEAFLWIKCISAICSQQEAPLETKRNWLRPIQLVSGACELLFNDFKPAMEQRNERKDQFAEGEIQEDQKEMKEPESKKEKMPFKMNPVEIREVFNGTFRALRLQSQGEVSFELEIGESIPLFIRTDEFRLVQVMMTIGSLVLKSVKEGVVRIKVDSVSQENIKGEMIGPIGLYQVVVTDTGCGMSPEFLSEIINGTSCFGHDQDSFSHLLNPNGVGIGLSYSVKIAQRLGRAPSFNSLTIDSHEAKGVSFSFYLEDKEDSSDEIPFIESSAAHLANPNSRIPASFPMGKMDQKSNGKSGSNSRRLSFQRPGSKKDKKATWNTGEPANKSENGLWEAEEDLAQAQSVYIGPDMKPIQNTNQMGGNKEKYSKSNGKKVNEKRKEDRASDEFESQSVKTDSPAHFPLERKSDDGQPNMNNWTAIRVANHNDEPLAKEEQKEAEESISINMEDEKDENNSKAVPMEINIKKTMGQNERHLSIWENSEI